MSDALDVITCAIERSPGLPPRHVAEVVENDLVNARLLPDPDDEPADHTVPQPFEPDWLDDINPRDSRGRSYREKATADLSATEPIDLAAAQALADAPVDTPHALADFLIRAPRVISDLVAESSTLRAQLDAVGDDQPRRLAAVKNLAGIGTGLLRIERDDARRRAAELETELEGFRKRDREDEEWNRRVAVDNVRCLYCNLRYGERDQYGCVGDGSRPHEYSDDELNRAREGGE